MKKTADMDRRQFLRKSSLGTLVGLLGPGDAVREIRPSPVTFRTPVDGTLRCGLIGFGVWGREVAAALESIEEITLSAICDEYPMMLRRAERAFPDAARHADYQALLDDPDIDAVMIATPTHLHRKLVVEALAAGKHVYCEAPMAASVEDARAIAQAAAAAPDQIFQVGLLYRTEPQYRSVFQFIRSGAIGKAVQARAQWHAKESWRRPSPSAQRERAQNWRLDAEFSLGLLGEVGLQQLDAASWMMGADPVRVTGYGTTMLWKDGRTVPDTVQAAFEYPDEARLMFDATLASSFDAQYELFHGTDSTIMLRDQKGWMFKEVDAPMLGWEVYARKDRFYKETGIALVANATKLDALGQDPTADDPNTQSPLWYALKAFSDNFFFGPYPPVADAVRGFETTVLAVAARDAIRGRTSVDIPPESLIP